MNAVALIARGDVTLAQLAQICASFGPIDWGPEETGPDCFSVRRESSIDGSGYASVVATHDLSEFSEDEAHTARLIVGMRNLASFYVQYWDIDFVKELLRAILTRVPALVDNDHDFIGSGENFLVLLGHRRGWDWRTELITPDQWE